MEFTARDLKLVSIGAVASVGLTVLLTSQYRNNVHAPCRIIDSPLPLIQSTLTKEQKKKLPYGPDALEGARDVETPFGSIRVYEWGPEDGKKVLLVHGISTPCVALGGLADELVQKGCRVMLFGELDSCSLHHLETQSPKKETIQSRTSKTSTWLPRIPLTPRHDGLYDLDDDQMPEMDI